MCYMSVLWATEKQELCITVVLYCYISVALVLYCLLSRGIMHSPSDVTQCCARYYLEGSIFISKIQDSFKTIFYLVSSMYFLKVS